jgi:hypothetical protein
MARRELVLKVESRPTDRQENRDAGKTFVVVEASAAKAEEWGLRAMMALGTSGITVPPEITQLGLIGVALIGYQAFMGSREEAIMPLWREMLPACVFFQAENGVRIPFNDTLIEEVTTLLQLRQMVMELQTGFTLAEIAQKLQDAGSALKLNSSTTSTSPAQ